MKSTQRAGVFPDGELASEVGATAVNGTVRIAFVMGLAVLAAALFLPHQSLWIDETTQLSGLTLSPFEVVRWLMHPASHDFGVPGDRMPPLSYWLGWLWSRPFGLNETSLRCFGIACTAGAAGLLCAAASRAFGHRAALFAGVSLALSPNVCVSAVEIRAYPLFLLTTAGALRALVIVITPPASTSLGPDPRADRAGWTSLGAWLLAGMYTHFYGALFAGVVTVALATARIVEGRSLKPPVVLGSTLAIGAIGLVPFVVASVGLSAATARDRRHEVLQLVYRLIGHPAMSVFPWVTALAFASAVVLVIVGARGLPDRPRRALGILGFVLLSGLALSVLADFLAAGFTAAKVSYATWALPLVSLILAAPLALPPGRWSRVVLAGAISFCGCEAVGVAQLARNGDYFSHGPQRYMQNLVEELRGRRFAIIHADSLEDYGAVYFPLRFVNGPALEQFVVSERGIAPPLGIPLEVAGHAADRLLRDDLALIVVRSKAQNAQQLADQIRHGDHLFGENKVIESLESSGEWRQLQHGHFVAFVAADVTVLERHRAAPNVPEKATKPPGGRPQIAR